MTRQCTCTKLHKWDTQHTSACAPSARTQFCMWAVLPWWEYSKSWENGRRYYVNSSFPLAEKTNLLETCIADFFFFFREICHIPDKSQNHFLLSLPRTDYRTVYLLWWIAYASESVLLNLIKKMLGKARFSSFSHTEILYSMKVFTWIMYMCII